MKFRHVAGALVLALSFQGVQAVTAQPATYDFDILTGTFETSSEIHHVAGTFNDTLTFELLSGQTGVSGDFSLYGNGNFYISVFNVTDGSSNPITLNSNYGFTLSGLTPGNYELLVSGTVVGKNDTGNAAHYTLSIMAVPEPETYAMFLAGLGLVGFIGRRKRAN